MARWLVNRKDTQFNADSMAELQDLARQGQLALGDLIQPPGAADWLYVVEIPELKELAGAADDEDWDDLPRSSSGAVTWVVAAVLLIAAVAGGYYMYIFGNQFPDPNQRLEDQIAFSEMVVTGDGATVRGEPEPTAPAVTEVPGGTVMELMAKRGDFYRARQKDASVEGWVDVDKVMPMYLLGGGDVIEAYDPLYNPDRYLLVLNASWMQLPEQRAEQITVFQFMLQNKSAYDMTDLVLVARIKDSKGHELEDVEFEVEGIVPANSTTMVGTIVDPDADQRRLITQATFDKLAEDDPELRLEYNDGVEVQMTTEDFTEASIDIVELRALPKDDPARG